MAGNFSNYGREDICNLIDTNKTLYVGLATEIIGNTDDLTTITEENDLNYTRQPISLGNIGIDGNNIIMKNNIVVEFPSYNSDADNPVTYCFLTEVETATTGNIYAYGELDENKLPLTGDKLVFDVNNLQFILNG
jgi:hypothetical protein